MRGLRVLVWVALAMAPVAAGAARDGHLVIIGGGERPAYLMEGIAALAGGQSARILIVPTASDEPDATAAAQKAELEAAGAGLVEVLSFTRESADSWENLERVAQASGVFFSGGDQRRLADALTGTELLARIHDLYERGGVVAGTSAGAAVMSPLMISGDAPRTDDPEHVFTTIRAGSVATRPGFNLLPGTVVDQHFLRRRRHNRLMSVVLEHPELLGIGIDEATAIIVGPPGRFEVIGESLVVVYDASWTDPITRDRNENLAVSGMTVHLLRAGQFFDLETRSVVP